MQGMQGILFMLLIIVCAIKASVVHNKFKRLVSGKNITGTIASELSARSKLVFRQVSRVHSKT